MINSAKFVVDTGSYFCLFHWYWRSKNFQRQSTERKQKFCLGE